MCVVVVVSWGCACVGRVTVLPGCNPGSRTNNNNKKRTGKGGTPYENPGRTTPFAPAYHVQPLKGTVVHRTPPSAKRFICTKGGKMLQRVRKLWTVSSNDGRVASRPGYQMGCRCRRGPRLRIRHRRQLIHHRALGQLTSAKPFFA